jgi:hypothetical protein
LDFLQLQALLDRLREEEAGREAAPPADREDEEVEDDSGSGSREDR